VQGVCRVGKPAELPTAFHKLILATPTAATKKYGDIFGVISLQNNKLNKKGYLTIGGPTDPDGEIVY